MVEHIKENFLLKIILNCLMNTQTISAKSRIHITPYYPSPSLQYETEHTLQWMHKNDCVVVDDDEVLLLLINVSACIMPI